MHTLVKFVKFHFEVHLLLMSMVSNENLSYNDAGGLSEGIGIE